MRRRRARRAGRADAAPSLRRRGPRRRSPADDVAARVLEVVAEQTGYPTELLDMDLDLEADLGIDTVKQAEVFATIRETYGIERDDALKLRDYPTLNHVVAFVNERSGAATRPSPWRRRRQRRPSRSRRLPRRPSPPPCRRRRARRPRRLRVMWRRGCWRSWLSRRVIRRICWTWIWIWRRIWGSTRSSRRRCSRRSGRPMGSSVTMR